MHHAHAHHRHHHHGHHRHHHAGLRSENAAPPKDVMARTAVFDYKSGYLIMPNGQVIKANSGLRECRNNPDKQSLDSRGPIPEGTWRIGDVSEHDFHLAHSTVRGPAASLTPVNANTHGRDGFLIHAAHTSGGDTLGCIGVPKDEISSVLTAASHGKITRLVVTRDVRMAAQNDPTLASYADALPQENTRLASTSHHHRTVMASAASDNSVNTPGLLTTSGGTPITIASGPTVSAGFTAPSAPS